MKRFGEYVLLPLCYPRCVTGRPGAGPAVQADLSRLNMGQSTDNRGRFKQAAAQPEADR